MDSGFRLLPEHASQHAMSVDRLAFVLFGISAFFTVAIAAAVIIFAVRYRRRPGQPTDRSVQPGDKPRSSMALELTWTIIPLIIVAGMFVAGAQLFVRAAQSPQNAMEIYVIGKQWMWKIQHPSGVGEINALHIPTGRPIRLVMISEDVIHDFGMPAFRIKQDVLPGRYTNEWFQADRPGEYHLFCDQYCGTDHSKMVGTIYAMPPAEYERWLEGQPVNQSPREAGEKLFGQYGCVTCHSARAPTMAGLYGRTVLLEGGGSVVADDNYLRESILYPSARIVRGFPPIMPSYHLQLTEQQVMELIAYIKSLAGATREPYQLDSSGAATQPTRYIPGPGPFLPEQLPREQP